MAGTAPAYQYDYPERLAPQSPHVRVIPGDGQQGHTRSLSPTLIAFARVLTIVLVVAAVLAVLRIGLASATVTTAVKAEKVSTQIENTRASNEELETRERQLSNPAYLKIEASKLHMGAGEAPVTITLPEDMVKTDETGALSLSLSLRAVAQQG